MTSRSGFTSRRGDIQASESVYSECGSLFGLVLTTSFTHRHLPSSQILERWSCCWFEELCEAALGLLLLSEHLGHFPICLFGCTAENSFVNAGLVAVVLLTVSIPAASVLPRQQHEFPPNIWLVATANSKTILKGIKNIERQLIVRFLGRTSVGCYIVGCPSRQTRIFTNYPSTTHLFVDFLEKTVVF